MTDEELFKATLDEVANIIEYGVREDDYSRDEIVREIEEFIRKRIAKAGVIAADRRRDRISAHMDAIITRHDYTFREMEVGVSHAIAIEDEIGEQLGGGCD